MDIFYGTKKIRAKEMNRLEYCRFRGWQVPADENPLDEGYLVEYLNGGPANVVGFENYVSWSPKDVFERAYQASGNLSFGHAMVALEEGLKVARSGWNGKGMFLFLVPGSTFKVNRPPLMGIYPEGTEIKYHSHVDMKTATDEVVPWLCSQTDMQAKDWCIVP